MSFSVWLHDKLKKHFFRLKDGQFTHCYRLHHEVAGCGNFNHWWQVPIPQEPWAQRRKLKRVPNDCEIDHQLYLMENGELPPAGNFFKPCYSRHPRRNQWGELNPMEQKPERWGTRPHRISRSDFVSAPFYTDADKY